MSGVDNTNLNDDSSDSKHRDHQEQASEALSNAAWLQPGKTTKLNEKTGEKPSSDSTSKAIPSAKDDSATTEIGSSIRQGASQVGSRIANESVLSSKSPSDKTANEGLSNRAKILGDNISGVYSASSDINAVKNILPSAQEKSSNYKISDTAAESFEKTRIPKDSFTTDQMKTLPDVRISSESLQNVSSAGANLKQVDFQNKAERTSASPDFSPMVSKFQESGKLNDIVQVDKNSYPSELRQSDSTARSLQNAIAPEHSYISEKSKIGDLVAPTESMRNVLSQMGSDPGSFKRNDEVKQLNLSAEIAHGVSDSARMGLADLATPVKDTINKEVINKDFTPKDLSTVQKDFSAGALAGLAQSPIKDNGGPGKDNNHPAGEPVKDSGNGTVQPREQNPTQPPAPHEVQPQTQPNTPRETAPPVVPVRDLPTTTGTPRETLPPVAKSPSDVNQTHTEQKPAVVERTTAAPEQKPPTVERPSVVERTPERAQVPERNATNTEAPKPTAPEKPAEPARDQGRPISESQSQPNKELMNQLYANEHRAVGSAQAEAANTSKNEVQRNEALNSNQSSLLRTSINLTDTLQNAISLNAKQAEASSVSIAAANAESAAKSAVAGRAAEAAIQSSALNQSAQASLARDSQQALLQSAQSLKSVIDLSSAAKISSVLNSATDAAGARILSTPIDSRTISASLDLRAGSTLGGLSPLTAQRVDGAAASVLDGRLTASNALSPLGSRITDVTGAAGIAIGRPGAIASNLTTFGGLGAIKGGDRTAGFIPGTRTMISDANGRRYLTGIEIGLLIAAVGIAKSRGDAKNGRLDGKEDDLLAGLKLSLADGARRFPGRELTLSALLALTGAAKVRDMDAALGMKTSTIRIERSIGGIKKERIEMILPQITLPAKPEEQEPESDPAKLDNQLLGFLPAASVFLKRRQSEADKDAVKLEKDKDEDSSKKSLPILRYRRVHQVQADESLVSIAENKLKDGNLAWLIADINAAKTTERKVDGKRVVEVLTGQMLELPLASEIAAFYKRDDKEADPDNLVTIIVEPEFDQERIERHLNEVLGFQNAS